VDRVPFTPSDIAAIHEALMPIEREAARQRMSEGGKGGKIAQPSTSGAVRARDRVGAIAGVSGRTVEKMVAVAAAAEAEPEKYGKLLADMDRTGRADGPYKRLKNMQQAEAIHAEPPPLPGNGLLYRVITADVPWPYEAHMEDPRASRGAAVRDDVARRHQGNACIE
jgi:hypothetical protein